MNHGKEECYWAEYMRHEKRLQTAEQLIFDYN